MKALGFYQARSQRVATDFLIELGDMLEQLLAEGAHRILLIAPKPLLGQWRQEDLGPLGTDAPDAWLVSVESELTALRVEEAGHAAQLAHLTAESSSEVASATRALTAARERIPLARQALEQATAAAEAARQEQATRQGEWMALEAQLEAVDRDALNATLRQREADLASFGTEPDLAPTALDAAVLQLERTRSAQNQCKEELNLAEGKLSNTGGAALRENVERLREALQQARDDEVEVEVEAEAWKLLRNTLREVENEEGAHLGRALAGPVTAKFRELTADRYPTLLLNPLLRWKPTVPQPPRQPVPTCSRPCPSAREISSPP